MKVIVLGCGLVGGAIVRDLARQTDLEITVVDSSQEALDKATKGLDVKTIAADLTPEGATKKIAAGQDIAVGAVPGWLGLQTVREALEAGCQVADISFMPEDPFELDSLAKEKGRTAIVDCGVAPGLSNLLVGRAAAALDGVTEVKILVGGLPMIRFAPYEYAVVFSPADVLEEYTRPAYILEGGKTVVRPALSELETIDVPGVGTLEAFLTDGLRTLRKTIDAPNMKEKTLRYPGHCEQIRLLSETGLLDEEPIEVAGVSVKPRDVTAKLLNDVWRLGPGEEDLTVLHVEVAGMMGDQLVRHVYNMIDVFDTEGGVTSMARTTGYSCTAMVNLLAQGKFKEPGVIPPELMGSNSEICDDVLGHLAEREVNVAESVEALTE